MGVKLGSVTLKEKQTMRLSEKGADVTGAGENCIMKSFIICILLQILLG
jgi:hypothetical protein